jgi:hypothetical protein
VTALASLEASSYAITAFCCPPAFAQLSSQRRPRDSNASRQNVWPLHAVAYHGRSVIVSELENDAAFRVALHQLHATHHVQGINELSTRSTTGERTALSCPTPCRPVCLSVSQSGYLFRSRPLAHARRRGPSCSHTTTARAAHTHSAHFMRNLEHIVASLAILVANPRMRVQVCAALSSALFAMKLARALAGRPIRALIGVIHLSRGKRGCVHWTGRLLAWGVFCLHCSALTDNEHGIQSDLHPLVSIASASLTCNVFNRSEMLLKAGLVGAVPGFRYTVEVQEYSLAGAVRQQQTAVFSGNESASDWAVSLVLFDERQTRFRLTIGVWDAHEGLASQDAFLAFKDFSAPLSCHLRAPLGWEREPEQARARSAAIHRQNFSEIPSLECQVYRDICRGPNV